MEEFKGSGSLAFIGKFDIRIYESGFLWDSHPK